MSSAIPSGPVAGLPVWRSVKASVRTVFLENLRHFPRAAALPLVITLFIWLLQRSFAIGSPQGDSLAIPGFSLGELPFFIAGTVPTVIFAVAWHRLMLLGPERGYPDGRPSWQHRHWAFLGYSLAFSALYFLAGLIVGRALGSVASSVLPVGTGSDGGGAILAITMWALPMILVAWLVARLCFVLPATAVGERYGLGDSWRQTQGLGLRLMAAFVLLFICVVLPLVLMMNIVAVLATSLLGIVFGLASGAQQVTGEDSFLLVFLPVVVFYIGTYLAAAVYVSLLSIAFRTCSGWVPDEPADVST